jgi:hypothetical protein
MAPPNAYGTPCISSASRRATSFLGPAASEDAGQAAFWRRRSAADHAAAGAQLSDLAAMIAAQTGQSRDPAG